MKTILAGALALLTVAGGSSMARAQPLPIDSTFTHAATPHVEQARYQGRRVVRHYRRGGNAGAAAFGIAAGALIGGAIAAHERNRYDDRGYYGDGYGYRRGAYDRGYGYGYGYEGY